MKPTLIGAHVAEPVDPALPDVGLLADVALLDVGLVAAFLLLDEHAPSTPAIITAARTDNSFRLLTFSTPPPWLADARSAGRSRKHRYAAAPPQGYPFL
jgi:hypothetical protein